MFSVDVPPLAPPLLMAVKEMGAFTATCDTDEPVELKAAMMKIKRSCRVVADNDSYRTCHAGECVVNVGPRRSIGS